MTFLTPRQRDEYAAEVLAACRKIQVRFPSARIPGESIADLAEALAGESADPRDITIGVSLLARDSSFYDEHQLRERIAVAKKRRLESTGGGAHLQLVASNPRTAADQRAGGIVARLIARAVWQNASAFKGVDPAVLTARQNRLRESIAQAIESESTITDETLMARFGKAGGA
jgi:hypothetical protein